MTLRSHHAAPRVVAVGWLLVLTLVVGPMLALAESEEGHGGARHLVFFKSGRSMKVVSIEPSPDWPTFLRLALPGGGSVTVSRGQVLKVTEIEEELPPVPSGRSTLGRWATLIERSAEKHGLDPQLVAAIIAVESAGDPDAVSPKGAVGLMQVLPTTAADYGVTELTDPRTNIDVGCRHLAGLLERHDGDVELALAAYNAGEGAVARAGGIPPYRETQHYVEAVTRRWRTAQRPGS
ncbi:MAG: lytic transglycosylase domain-containing protein [Acidobacteriota bacterium]